MLSYISLALIMSFSSFTSLAAFIPWLAYTLSNFPIAASLFSKIAFVHAAILPSALWILFCNHPWILLVSIISSKFLFSVLFPYLSLISLPRVLTSKPSSCAKFIISSSNPSNHNTLLNNQKCILPKNKLIFSSPFYNFLIFYDISIASYD